MAFHLPKIFSQVAQIISVTTEKIRKQKHRPKIGKMVYSDDTRKTEKKAWTSRENTGWVACFRWKMEK